MPNDETPEAKTERLEDEAREKDEAGQSCLTTDSASYNS